MVVSLYPVAFVSPSEGSNVAFEGLSSP